MDAEHGPEVQEPENKEAGGDKGEPAKEVKAEQGMEMDPEVQEVEKGAEDMVMG